MSPGTPAITEFPDFVSPLLVRELRRMLRAPSTMAGFVVLQIVALCGTLLGLLPPGEPGWSRGWVSTEVDLLTLFAALFFTFFLPLCHANDLQRELGPGRNIELLALSRIGGRRLIVHLHFAAMAVTLLLVFSILPHYSVFYLLGKIEPLEIAENLAGILLSASAMTGIVIGASGIASIAGRIGTILSLYLAYEWITWIFYLSANGFVRLSGPWVFLSEALIALLFTFFGLLLGHSRVAALEKRGQRSWLLSMILLALFGCLLLTVIVPVAGPRNGLPVLVMFIAFVLILASPRVANRG